MGTTISQKQCQSWGSKRLSGALTVIKRNDKWLDEPDLMNVSIWNNGNILLTSLDRRKLSVGELHIVGPADSLLPNEGYEETAIRVVSNTFDVILRAESLIATQTWISCVSVSASEFKIGGSLCPLVIQSPTLNKYGVPLVEGFLQKRASQAGDWQLRYFILVHNILLYFTSIKQAEALKLKFLYQTRVSDMSKVLATAVRNPLCRGYIRLESRGNRIHIGVTSALDERCTFSINYGQRRNFTVKTENVKYAIFWKKEIQKIINKYKAINASSSRNSASSGRDQVDEMEGVNMSRMNSMNSIEDKVKEAARKTIEDKVKEAVLARKSLPLIEIPTPYVGEDGSAISIKFTEDEITNIMDSLTESVKKNKATFSTTHNAAQEKGLGARTSELSSASQDEY